MRVAKMAYAAALLAVVWPARPSSAAGTGAPAAKGWVVLPARGERPPPRDPTLMRLSEALAGAIEGAVGAEVVVADRAMAEEACPGEGDACPRDVAILVSAARVVSIVLLEDQSAVDLRVYAPRVGLQRTVRLACQWQEGLLACETAELAQKLEAKAEAKIAAAPAERAAPAKARRRASAPSPPADEVSRAFAAAAPRLARCAKEGWGALPAAERPAAVSVRFRVADDGALRDVRLEPSGLLDVPALGCMARVVESLAVSPEASSDAVRTEALPLP